LPIDAGMDILDIGQSGLDLIDRARALRGSPTQQIDGSTFAVVVERVFDDCFPARRSVTAYRLLDEGRVAGVQELCALGWREARVDLRGDPERRPDAADRRERQSVQLPPLDEGHGVLAHVGAPSDIDLAQTV